MATLDYWARSRFLPPSIADARGTGSRRLYSFRDIVALRVVRELREKGITLPALRKVVAFLRGRFDVQQPLSALYLVTDGHDVFVKGAQTLLSALKSPGQGCLSFVVMNLTEAVTELRSELHDMQTA